MGAYASLMTNNVQVRPGGEATCQVKLRNTGTVVDEFTFEVILDDDVEATWATVEPHEVPLFPGAEGTVTIRFAPPQLASIPAGPLPFGIRVVSREDPDGSVVEEGTLEIAPYVDVGGELAPRTRHGRFSARFNVALDNVGNAPVSAIVDVKDPAESLRFRYAPALTAAPGTRASARLRARPKRTIVRGQPKLHPFVVTLEPEGAAPVSLDGQMLQEAVVPKWLLWAVLALAALAVLWLVLLKPAVESAAKDAARPAASQAALAADKAATSAEDANQAADDAKGSADDATDTVKNIKDVVSPAPQAPSFDARLATAEATPGTNGEVGAAVVSSFTVPNKKIAEITDLVLENPNGDSGTLTLQRVTSSSDTPTILLVFSLGNFRDLDYHFLTAPQFQAGDQFVMSVACTAGGVANPASPPPTPGNCSGEATYFTYLLKNAPKK